MSSNYPEVSMRGSGIYSVDHTGTFYCAECDDEFTLDGATDDFGLVAYADCPKCGQQLELELPSKDDLAEELAYENWRDSQDVA